MSTRKLTEAERQFRLAQAKQCMDFIAGRAPAQRLNKREREERQRVYELQRKRLTQLVAADLARRNMPALARRKRRGPLDIELDEAGYLAVDPNSPDWNFIGRRMNELIQRGSDASEAWQQAFVDLIRSDVPIAARVLRGILEDVLARFFWPEREKQRVLDEAQWWQDYCTNVAGMTPGEAKVEAAAKVGLTVEALLGRRRPDRMPKKQYCKQKQGPR